MDYRILFKPYNKMEKHKLVIKNDYLDAKINENNYILAYLE